MINQNKMKKTAVEWLNEKLISKGVLFEYELLDQAKEMEKEQIMKAFHKQTQKFYCDEESEQYYNETFKTNKV